MHATTHRPKRASRDAPAPATTTTPLDAARAARVPTWAAGATPAALFGPAQGIQAKLMVNEPGDVYEQEADRVAEQVMRLPEPSGGPRRCACGGIAGPDGECAACRAKRLGVQRRATTSTAPPEAPPLVHDVLRAPGQPLDAGTRTFMESRFGHDFGGVRLHTDTQAAESARALGALAYTSGQNIVFGAGQYVPHSSVGRSLLAHELTHVVQQGNTAAPAPSPQAPVLKTNEGGYRIAVAPEVEEGPPHLEEQAERNAARVAAEPSGDSVGQAARPRLAGDPVQRRLIQRARVPLPSPVPLCGRSLTHIDVEPPRWRPLVPCLPPTVLVNRINIVGREVSSRTIGRGRIIFNLHIGYYRDPATGRLCVIADDSKTCIAPRCLSLGCFPTLREVLDAIRKFLWEALKVIGIILLIILWVLILRWLRGLPGPGPAPVPVPIASGGGESGESEGEGETEETAEV